MSLGLALGLTTRSLPRTLMRIRQEPLPTDAARTLLSHGFTSLKPLSQRSPLHLFYWMSLDVLRGSNKTPVLLHQPRWQHHSGITRSTSGQRPSACQDPDRVPELIRVPGLVDVGLDDGAVDAGLAPLLDPGQPSLGEDYLVDPL